MPSEKRAVQGGIAVCSSLPRVQDVVHGSSMPGEEAVHGQKNEETGHKRKGGT